MVLCPLNLEGTATTESLSWGASACAIGAGAGVVGRAAIDRGVGVGCLGGVKLSGKGVDLPARLLIQTSVAFHEPFGLLPAILVPPGSF